MAYFPIFMDLSERTIVIAGGFKYAERRLRALLPFAKRIIVISDAFSESFSGLLESLAEDERVVVHRRAYESGDIDGAFLVFACTKDKDLNRRIMEECRKKGILGNAIFDKEHSGFSFPGLVYRDPFVIGFAAGGEAHHLVGELRARTAEIAEELLERLK